MTQTGAKEGEVAATEKERFTSPIRRSPGKKKEKEKESGDWIAWHFNHHVPFHCRQ